MLGSEDRQGDGETAEERLRRELREREAARKREARRLARDARVSSPEGPTTPSGTAGSDPQVPPSGSVSGRLDTLEGQVRDLTTRQHDIGELVGLMDDSNLECDKDIITIRAQLATERDAAERARADFAARVAALEARPAVDLGAVREELAECRESVSKSNAEMRDFLRRAEAAHATHLRQVQKTFLFRLADADRPGLLKQLAADARRALAEIEAEVAREGSGSRPADNAGGDRDEDRGDRP